MWVWSVLYGREGEEGVGCIYSEECWSHQWKAEANIEARMNAIPPQIPGLPPDAFIIEVSVSYHTSLHKDANGDE